MKKSMNLLLGTALVLGSAAIAFSQGEKKSGNRKEPVMRAREKNVEAMLGIFRAIERRDPQRMLDLMQPDVEFHWPPSLPYSGTSTGLEGKDPTWGETWSPLQPTEAERRMDPRVVAASDNEVVVLWRQQGIGPAGERFDGKVLGLYRLREGKLARAQMFYFDPAAVVSFLAKAKGEVERRGNEAFAGHLPVCVKERRLPPPPMLR